MTTEEHLRFLEGEAMRRVDYRAILLDRNRITELENSLTDAIQEKLEAKAVGFMVIAGAFQHFVPFEKKMSDYRCVGRMFGIHGYVERTRGKLPRQVGFKVKKDLVTILVDEEGLIKSLPVNRVATRLHQRAYAGVPSNLHGTAVICVGANGWNN